MDEDLRSRYRVTRDRYDAPVRTRREPAHHQTHTAPSDQQHANIPAKAAHQINRRPKRMIFKKLFFSVLFLAFLGTAAAWGYPRYMEKNPFPPNIQTNSQVQLFYPNKLPPGFEVDKTKMHFANGALIYDAKKADLRLVFTLQKTPPNYNYTNFYQQDLKNLQDLNSPYGKAVVGRYQDRVLGSLVSGNTWLLLSTNSTSVTNDDMSLVISNLKKY